MHTDSDIWVHHRLLNHRNLCWRSPGIGGPTSEDCGFILVIRWKLNNYHTSTTRTTSLFYWLPAVDRSPRGLAVNCRTPRKIIMAPSCVTISVPPSLPNIAATGRSGWVSANTSRTGLGLTKAMAFNVLWLNGYPGGGLIYFAENVRRLTCTHYSPTANKSYI